MLNIRNKLFATTNLGNTLQWKYRKYCIRNRIFNHVLSMLQMSSGCPGDKRFLALRDTLRAFSLVTMQDVVLLVGLFNHSEWASPTDGRTDVATYRMRGGELWDRSRKTWREDVTMLRACFQGRTYGVFTR